MGSTLYLGNSDYFAFYFTSPFFPKFSPKSSRDGRDVVTKQESKDMCEKEN